VDVDERTVVVWSDITCPWAHLAVHRLHAARAELGGEETIAIDHRAFPLELHNRVPTPWRIVQSEVGVVGALDPEAGWEIWQAEPWQWPVTSLPALEAVQAAKEQGLAASAALDRALRRAFFAESRCVAMRAVILGVAGEVDEVDTEKLAEALDDGRARREVMAQFEASRGDEIAGSPHLFLPDGTGIHNPGIEMHWNGAHGVGFPVVDHDDPAVYAAIVERAAA
jgi:predicted DsbA family dithiol-disulfide isomerase